MQAQKSSFAIATGVATSKIKYDDNDIAGFTLRTGDGMIYVKVARHLLPHLQKGDHLSVVGYLSSQHSRCGSMMFLHATVILASSYPNIWDDIGIPALLRTIYALEKRSI